MEAPIWKSAGRNPMSRERRLGEPVMSLTRVALIAGSILLVSSACLADDIGTRESQEVIIRHEIDTTGSRVLRHSQQPLEKQQLQRDLGAIAQNLDAFKTQYPNAAATPLFERRLDQLERPARILQPGSPTLLPPGPPSLLGPPPLPRGMR
jgi:hypothetical protein